MKIRRSNRPSPRHLTYQHNSGPPRRVHQAQPTLAEAGCSDFALGSFLRL